MPASPRIRLCTLLLCTAAALAAGGCGREEIQPTAPDTTPPLPPSGLLLESAQDGYVFFSWEHNTESDLAGYVIWRSEERDSTAFTAIDTTRRNWYVDGGRSYDTTYHYRITAIDKSGNQSTPSPMVTASSPNLHAPAAPAELYAEGRNDGTRRGIRVSWTPVDEFDLAGYRVYRSEDPNHPPDAATFLVQTERAVFDDSTARDVARDWTYTVTAVDRGGRESAASARATEHITGVPQLLDPADGAQVPAYSLFRWSSAEGAVQYRMIVSSTADAGEVWTTTVNGNGSSTHAVMYTGPALAVGRTYVWRVAALSRADGEANGISAPRSFLVAP